MKKTIALLLAMLTLVIITKPGGTASVGNSSISEPPAVQEEMEDNTMPNVPVLNIGGNDYNVKDQEARNQIDDLKSAFGFKQGTTEFYSLHDSSYYSSFDVITDYSNYAHMAVQKIHLDPGIYSFDGIDNGYPSINATFSTIKIGSASPIGLVSALDANKILTISEAADVCLTYNYGHGNNDDYRTPIMVLNKLTKNNTIYGSLFLLDYANRNHAFQNAFFEYIVNHNRELTAGCEKSYYSAAGVRSVPGGTEHISYSEINVPAGTYFVDSWQCVGSRPHFNGNFCFAKVGNAEPVALATLMSSTICGGLDRCVLNDDAKLYITVFWRHDSGAKIPFVAVDTYSYPGGSFGIISLVDQNRLYNESTINELTFEQDMINPKIETLQGMVRKYYGSFGNLLDHGVVTDAHCAYPVIELEAGDVYLDSLDKSDRLGVNPPFCFIKIGSAEPVNLGTYLGEATSDGVAKFSLTESALLCLTYNYYQNPVAHAAPLQISKYKINGKTITVIHAMDNIDRSTIYVAPEGSSYIRDFTKLTDAIAYANDHPNTTIRVFPGVYDITQEIDLETAGAGPTVGNGTKLIFDTGAKVKCIYTGGSASVEQGFSPFNLYRSDCEIYNLDLECKNTRYCIHDECSNDGDYIHKFVNCKMKQDVSQSSWHSYGCIGGGLGRHGTIEIIGGYYESVLPSDYQDYPWIGEIFYHNSQVEGTWHQITVKDVYCKNSTFVVQCLGQEQTVSMCYVSNCSFAEAPRVYDEYDEHLRPYRNMEIIGWNNEIRTN